MIEKLLADHENIRTLGSRLKALLSQETPPDHQALASTRWALASGLMQHLAVKERYIYSKLEKHERSDVRQYFASSKGDLQRRFDAYAAHMKRWSTSDTQRDWSAYRRSATHACDLFLERLDLEERDLFPYVERIALDTTTPDSASSNWTRQAFEFKDNVTS